MDCRLVRQNVVDIVEGRLDPATLDACGRHRRECPACERLLSRVEAAWGEWDPAEGVRVSPGFVSRVIERAERDSVGERLFGTLRRNWRVVLQPVAVTLLLAGAVWFGAYLGGADSLRPDTHVSSASSSYYDVLTAYPSGSVADFYRPESETAQGGER